MSLRKDSSISKKSSKTHKARKKQVRKRTVISLAQAADMAEGTVKVAPIKAFFSPEEVNGLLCEQRELIGQRLRELEQS